MYNISLINMWNDALKSFTNINQKSANDLYDTIILTYSDENRNYHNTKHLAHMISILSELFKIYAFTDMQKNACIIATFFHDIVYSASHPDEKEPKTNEELSAEYAITHLTSIGITDYDTIELISTLIKLTETHKIDESCGIDPMLQSVFLDADMAIMGSESFRYTEYSDGVAVEYEDILPEHYIVGRKNFLTKLSKVKTIFLTEYMNQLYNDQAHINIEAEIKSLNAWYVELLTSI